MQFPEASENPYHAKWEGESLCDQQNTEANELGKM